jgi:hypothetical protein
MLDRELTHAEKVEVFNVFNRVGLRMGLTGLPTNLYPMEANARRALAG